MYKIVTFDLKLPNGKLKKVDLKFFKLRQGKEFLMDAVNLLANIFTALFFLTVFISHVFNFSRVAEVDFVIFLYTFVIIMAFFQFVRFVIGGDSFFPKVAYDMLVLLIPPVLILSLIINNNLSLGMFATLPTWNLAGISLLSFIILSYILALNFSKKEGFKNLNFWFDLGLILGGGLYFFNPAVVTPNLDVILVFFLPLNIFKLFRLESLRLKATSVVLIILGAFVLVNGVFLNNSFSTFIWDLPKLIFIGNSFITLFFIGKLISNRVEIKKSLAKTFGSKTLTIKVPKLQNKWLMALKVLAVAYFVVTSIWLLSQNFVNSYLTLFVTEVKTVFTGATLQNLVFGTTTNELNSFLLSILDTFGIPVVILLVGGILFILFRNRVSRQSIEFKLSAGMILTLLFMMIFFKMSVIFEFIFFFFLANLLISVRTEDFDFETMKLSVMNIKSKPLRIFLNIVKYLLIIVGLVGIIVVIASLTQIIGRNLR